MEGLCGDRGIAGSGANIRTDVSFIIYGTPNYPNTDPGMKDRYYEEPAKTQPHLFKFLMSEADSNTINEIESEILNTEPPNLEPNLIYRQCTSKSPEAKVLNALVLAKSSADQPSSRAADQGLGPFRV